MMNSHTRVQANTQEVASSAQRLVHCLPASDLQLHSSSAICITAAARTFACSARDARANLAFASPLRPPPVRMGVRSFAMPSPSSCRQQ